jgi:hypothetical protein
MEITEVEVAFLERSLKAAGLPRGRYEEPSCANALGHMRDGHDNFLSGISVAAVVRASQVWWMQWMRYHFNQQIVSSESKMHMIMTEAFPYHPATSKTAIRAFGETIESARELSDYAPESGDAILEAVAVSAPMGLELTAEIRTNYLQLKTQYRQRRNHRLSEWRQWCGWVEELPRLKELCL